VLLHVGLVVSLLVAAGLAFVINTAFCVVAVLPCVAGYAAGVVETVSTLVVTGFSGSKRVPCAGLSGGGCSFGEDFSLATFDVGLPEGLLFELLDEVL